MGVAVPPYLWNSVPGLLVGARSWLPSPARRPVVRADPGGCRVTNGRVAHSVWIHWARHSEWWQAMT